MATLEDLAYDRLFNRLSECSAAILSAHPPSGKAYDAELIRIPAKQRHAGRYHIDVIFILGRFLFLCELKGSSSESADDVSKLRDLTKDYTLDQLVSFISKRVNRTDIDWPSITEMVKVIGVVMHDCPMPGDFATLVAIAPGTFEVIVGNDVDSAGDVRSILATVF